MDIFGKKRIKELEEALNNECKGTTKVYNILYTERDELRVAKKEIEKLESMLETDVKSIDMLIADELKRANEKFELFANIREAESVLREEVEELEEDVEMLKQIHKGFWGMVRRDCNNVVICNSLIALRKLATYAIIEAVQVAAMCDKAMMLYKQEESEG